MYGDPATLPPVGRRPKKTRDQSRTHLGTLAFLTRGLDQSLTQGLHGGLYEGFTAPPVSMPGHSTSTQDFVPGTVGITASAQAFSGTTFRKVALLVGESISHTFSPELGLVSEPTEEGRMLVLTNRRVIAFAQNDGIRETVLIPVEEVKAVSVQAGRRSKGNLFQGGLMIVAAVFFYVLLAYWLTGRIDGPTVPIIRMDLVAFVVFLAILTGVTMMAQIYFAKPDGEVTFQGDGIKLVFPFKGEPAENDMFRVVNAAFASRETIAGDSPLAVK
ncbi:MAG: hypothetical protein FI737_02620 [SAR202 cluster bacterium]|nr:hypothetical protein [SAR202 cluster bacterium]